MTDFQLPRIHNRPTSRADEADANWSQIETYADSLGAGQGNSADAPQSTLAVRKRLVNRAVEFAQPQGRKPDGPRRPQPQRHDDRPRDIVCGAGYTSKDVADDAERQTPKDLTFSEDCRMTDRSEINLTGASSGESAEVQDVMEACRNMSLHMVYVGTGGDNQPRVLNREYPASLQLNEVPPGAEAVLLLCYADFLELTCNGIKTLKRCCQCPIIPVVLRPAHGVCLFKHSEIAVTLKKGRADNVIFQPRDKRDFQERLQAALGFASVRGELERNLMEEPDTHANTLFFEAVDAIIQGFPKLNAATEERLPTNDSLGGLGRYTFMKVLGEGKFGRVYTSVASDRQDASLCEAVKVISKRSIKSVKHCAGVLKECRLMQKARHSNVAAFQGLIHATKHVYIFMEFVGPKDLSEVIRSGENGRLNSSTVLELFLQICDAVSYCHQILVAHRDIKSDNIVVTSEGIPKLVDFGLACAVSAGELCFDKCGTIPFAGPEIYRGRKYDATALDVWGLGIVTLEMRCGVNSVCRMLQCKNAYEPDDALADIVEKFFNNPDWPTAVMDANPGVGIADELLAVMCNALMVDPQLRWRAADLWKHIADSNVEDRDTAGVHGWRSSSDPGSDPPSPKNGRPSVEPN